MVIKDKELSQFDSWEDQLRLYADQRLLKEVEKINWKNSCRVQNKNNHNINGGYNSKDSTKNKSGDDSKGTKRYKCS
jgi:hypothetical protein